MTLDAERKCFMHSFRVYKLTIWNWGDTNVLCFLMTKALFPLKKISNKFLLNGRHYNRVSYTMRNILIHDTEYRVECKIISQSGYLEKQPALTCVI